MTARIPSTRPVFFSGPQISAEPSAISYQIQSMERTVDRVLTELPKLVRLIPERAARIESDARDLLAHYHYAVSQLLTSPSLRDRELLFFDPANRRMHISEKPNRKEIEQGNSLLRKIESSTLDLSEAQDLISYRGATYELNKADDDIERITEEMYFHIYQLSVEKSQPSAIVFKTITERLTEQMQIVSDIVNDHALGIINSFTMSRCTAIYQYRK